jgi:hypothetical protein
MDSVWLKSVYQWVMVTLCALALTVPAPALSTFLVQTIGAIQVPDERETETVKTAPNESSRRFEGRRSSRRPPLQVFNHHFRPKAPTRALQLDLRDDLKSRFSSLRC